jgi:hypothetical protein
MGDRLGHDHGNVALHRLLQDDLAGLEVAGRGGAACRCAPGLFGAARTPPSPLRGGPYALRFAWRQSRPARAVSLRDSYYVALGKETERKVREETGLIDNEPNHHTKILLGKLEYEARKIGSNAKKSLTKLYIEYV